MSYSQDPTAVMGRRCVAWLVDMLIGFVPFVVWLVLTIPDFYSEEYNTSTEAKDKCDIVNEIDGAICIPFDTTALINDDVTLGLDLVLVLWLIVMVSVIIILPGFTGWSPGKLLTGLRIVKKDSFELTGFGRNILRSVLWVVDMIPFFFPLVGLVTGLSTKGHRRVGDLLAKTLVVHKSYVGRPGHVPGLTPPSQPPSHVSVGPRPSMSPEVHKPGSMQDEPISTLSTTTPAEETWAPRPDSATGQTATGQTATQEGSGTAEASTGHEHVEDRSEASAPGVDAPLWDEARNTYIQWDPELSEWMEWSEATGRWIPISR